MRSEKRCLKKTKAKQTTQGNKENEKWAFILCQVLVYFNPYNGFQREITVGSFMWKPGTLQQITGPIAV